MFADQTPAWLQPLLDHLDGSRAELLEHLDGSRAEFAIEQRLTREAFASLTRQTMGVIDRNVAAFNHLVEAFDRFERKMEENRQASEAHTEAIFRLLDRFDDRPGPEPAAG